MEANESQINYFVMLMRRSRIAKELFSEIVNGSDMCLMRAAEFARRISYDDFSDLLESLKNYDRTSNKNEREYVVEKIKHLIS